MQAPPMPDNVLDYRETIHLMSSSTFRKFALAFMGYQNSITLCSECLNENLEYKWLCVRNWEWEKLKNLMQKAVTV